jgi:HNH endonuclease
MARHTLPDAATIRKLLAYDPNTGVLTWRERPAELFTQSRYQATWNTRYAGQPAGAIDGQGYRVFGLRDAGTLQVHRVAWVIMTGEWPAHEIDHINRHKADNRWINLRQATHLENIRNATISARNTSGFKGVSYFRQNGLWHAYIRVNRLMVSLGFFNTPKAASEAYCRAARKYFGEFFTDGR